MGVRSPAFIDQHSIPAEPELYKIERFRDFLDARAFLLRKRYAEILGSVKHGLQKQPLHQRKKTT